MSIALSLESSWKPSPLKFAVTSSLFFEATYRLFAAISHQFLMAKFYNNSISQWPYSPSPLSATAASSTATPLTLYGSRTPTIRELQ